MKCLKPPEYCSPNGTTLFLAGGISGCPDWQADLLRLLSKEEITVFNPRRENFPIGDPTAAVEQISWEFRYLRWSHAISFWFPAETLCPIVLYELGAWSMGDKPLFVGVHPFYQRRTDVEIQTKLARPNVKVVYDLEILAQQIIDWNRHERK